MKFRIVTALFIFFVSFKSFGQRSDIIYNRFTIVNGLASNEILCEWQDKTGFIWIGTANGLQRFDGKRFVSFPAFNKTELNSEPVNQIIGDKNGNLWLKFGEHFGIFNPGYFTFRRIPVDIKTDLNHQSKLYTDETGNVFITKEGIKIFSYNQKQQKFTEDLPFALPKNWIVNTLFYDKRNQFYWICADSGLLIYDNSNKKYITEGQLGKNPFLNKIKYYNVLNVFVDSKSKIWLSYWPEPHTRGEYIACFNDSLKRMESNQVEIVTSTLGYNEVRQFFETDKGDLWITGTGILAKYNEQLHKFINIKSDLTANPRISYKVVNDIIEDKDHNIWIASDGGLYGLSPERPKVTNLYLPNKTENYLDGIAEINSQIWFASWSRGAFIYDSSLQVLIHDDSKTNFKENDKYLSWDICQSSKLKKVYIGCQHGWLRIQDPVSGKIDFVKPSIFNNMTIRSIIEDHDKNLWIATHEGRLFIYDPSQPPINQNFKEIQLLNSMVNRMFLDKEKNIWICSSNGLYCFNGSSHNMIRHYTPYGEKGKSLFDNTVTDIAQINDSIFALVANYFHILNIKTDSIKRYSYYNGISNNQVRSIVKDLNSNIWITTANGISRYNYYKNNFIRYNEKDGFEISESFGDHAIVRKDGSLVIAGGDQILTFNPDDFKQPTVSPEVFITDVKLFNDYLPIDSLRNLKEVSFKANQNSFIFYFSSLSFLMNDKLNYYYRLQGSNDEWLLADNSNSVNYSLLSPGKYSFQVKSINEQGISSEIRTFDFVIVSPFYKSWWFIALVSLFLCADLYIIIQTKSNKRLAIEKMRSMVARDLHDDMGSTLSTINILSAMAKNRLPVDTIRTEEYLNKISDNSQRMMDAMDDIVWSIKPSNDSMNKIAGRMREFSTNVLEAKNIDIDFRVDEGISTAKLNMTARRDLFLLFKEAINNLAKYSRATKATIHLGIHKKRLVMVIKDNGVGFNIDKVEDGNGLANMKKRAEMLKGRLVIQSKINIGTVVSLNMMVN